MKSALLKLHLAVFIWGFTGILGKAITLNSGWLTWWRMLITVLSLWLLYGYKKRIQKISLKDFYRIGFVGFILALHWLCFYGSIKLSNVSIALTCLSTSGLVAALLEPVFFKRKIRTSEILLGTLTLVGVFIIYYTNLHFSTGIYIGLLAMLLTVFTSILNKKLVNDFKSETITVYQLTGGFAALTVLMPLYHFLFPTANIFPVKYDWLWLVILAWVCTIWTYFLYVAALRKITPFTMNLTLTLEPVYGIILAFALYKENESLSNYFYIGFILILLAVFLQTRSLVKKDKTDYSGNLSST